MARPTNPEIDREIATLRAAHKSEQTIAEILTRRGLKITASGVHRALGRLGLAKSRGDVAKPGRKPRAPNAPAAPSDDATNAEGTPIERLTRAVTSLESAARQAATDGDIARVIQAQKAVGDLTALIERLRPPPAVTVNDRPDMQATAERVRRRMHELLDRLLKERT